MTVLALAFPTSCAWFLVFSNQMSWLGGFRNISFSLFLFDIPKTEDYEAKCRVSVYALGHAVVLGCDILRACVWSYRGLSPRLVRRKQEEPHRETRGAFAVHCSYLLFFTPQIRRHSLNSRGFNGRRTEHQIGRLLIGRGRGGPYPPPIPDTGLRLSHLTGNSVKLTGK